MQRRISLLLLSIIGFTLSNLSPLAQDEAMLVVASHSILADVARNVAADQATVNSLIPASADPHSFIPSPGDLTDLSSADIVFINGTGYEERLLDAIESAGETANIVNVSACIQVRPFGAAMHDDEEHASEEDDDDAQDDELADDLDEMDGESVCDAHDAEFAALVGEEEGAHAHFTTLGRAGDIDCGIEHGHDDTGHANGEGACDPHLWMDPHNVIYWVLMIRDTLSAADPDNAASYATNSADYAQELVALEAEFILPALEALPAEQRVLVTSHESLGYFATTFGFEIVTTIVPGMATMVEPSARDIAALIDRIRAEGVPAVFSDTQSSDSTMRTISSEAGVKMFGLYSDTLSDSNGPAATYLEYMRYNVTTIVEALKGE